MARAWLMLCLLLGIGCSAGPLPSGSLDNENQPMILLRCQEGRVAAYITMDRPDELNAGSLPDGSVPVQLDSPPSC